MQKQIVSCNSANNVMMVFIHFEHKTYKKSESQMRNLRLDLWVSLSDTLPLSDRELAVSFSISWFMS